MSDYEELLEGESHETIGGVVFKIAIGTDMHRRIVEQLGSETGKEGEPKITVTRIGFDENFLMKHGRVRILIFTKVNGKEKVWKQIIDTTVIIYKLPKPNELSKNTTEHSNHKSRSKN